MQFGPWYEELKTQTQRRLGLNFETDFSNESPGAWFVEGVTPTEVIDRLIQRFGLDDLTQWDNPFHGVSMTIDVVDDWED